MTTLTLDHVSKSFNGVTVIEDVTLTVTPGHVLVLLGENGAGKSTLIKMMSGIYQPDGGKIIIDDQVVTLPNVAAAKSHGIATIHQELNLAGQLSIAENISMGELPEHGGVVDRKAMNERAERALAMVGLKTPVTTKVKELGIAQRQQVEIARALSQDASLLILDEPTAALTSTEAHQLFAMMEQLREEGVAMVFISHHLDEIARIGDTVAVLRDGILIGEVPASTDEDELIRMMVGRDVGDQYPRRRGELGEPVLQIKNLTKAGDFDDVSVTVRAGEVVGLAGLVGAGRTEVLRAVMGAEKYDSGTVHVMGKPMPRGSIAEAVKDKLGFVPEDRKDEGLVLDASVATNIGMATLFPTATAGLVDFRGQAQRAAESIKQLRIRTAGPWQPIRQLSGGNQQKVVFGRWTSADSKILLLDEPTRGVDVGARVEIYELINEVTANGGAVLMASSDLPEVLGMSDRVVVMSEGRVTGELNAEDATQDAVMHLAVSRMSDKDDEKKES